MVVFFFTVVILVREQCFQNYILDILDEEGIHVSNKPYETIGICDDFENCPISPRCKFSATIFNGVTLLGK